MTGAAPGAGSVRYRIHHLAMRARPGFGWPTLPPGREAALLRAEAPPAWFFLALYEAVGRDYAWEPPLGGDAGRIAGWLADPAVLLYTLMRAGWPHGFFVLDARAGDTVRLAQFGLVPEARGRGYGRFLIGTAVLTAWSVPGVRALVATTTSLDHPHALTLYQMHGFEIVGQETATRILHPGAPDG